MDITYLLGKNSPQEEQLVQCISCEVCNEYIAVGTTECPICNTYYGEPYWHQVDISEIFEMTAVPSGVDEHDQSVLDIQEEGEAVEKALADVAGALLSEYNVCCDQHWETCNCDNHLDFDAGQKRLPIDPYAKDSGCANCAMQDTPYCRPMRAWMKSFYLEDTSPPRIIRCDSFVHYADILTKAGINQ